MDFFRWNLFEEFKDDPNCPHRVEDLPDLAAKYILRGTSDSIKVAEHLSEWHHKFMKHIEAEYSD